MFWHASGALGLRYVMVPLAQSWWLDPTVHVPGLDMIDALAIALNREDPTGCGAGERGGKHCGWGRGGDEATLAVVLKW